MDNILFTYVHSTHIFHVHICILIFKYYSFVGVCIANIILQIVILLTL